MVCYELVILLRVFYRCEIRLDGLGSSLKKEKDILLVIIIEIKKKSDLSLFKDGVYKSSIYSLYFHLPSNEKSKAVALGTNYKPGKQEH